MNARMKRYQRIHRLPVRYLPIMLLAAFSINVLSLALPLAMKQIYGRILPEHAKGQFELLLIGCVVALLLETILRNVKENTGKWISSKYELQLNDFLVDTYLDAAGSGKPTSNYQSNLERFQSIARVTAFNANALYQSFVDVPFMFFFLFCIYYFSGILVLVPITLSLLYIFYMLLNGRKFAKNRGKQLDASDTAMEELVETLEKIHLVKSMGIEEFQLKRYRNALEESNEANYLANRYQMKAELVAPYFSQITMFAILLSGGYLMLESQITFGEITACALLGSRAIAPIQSLMYLLLQKRDVKLLRERLDDLAKMEGATEGDLPEITEELQGAVELFDLEYPNLFGEASERVTKRIKPGEMIFLDPVLNPSYRGILYRIAGRTRIEKEGGRVLLDNLDIRNWNMSSVKGNLEYLSDQVKIFSGTVLENITFFSPEKSSEAYDAAALTGLDGLISEMSDGYETVLEIESDKFLSSAFLQRLNLTRALLSRPRVLIVDRVDEAMDRDTLELFLWILRKLRGRTTILIATTNRSIQGMADRDFFEKEGA